MLFEKTLLRAQTTLVNFQDFNSKKCDFSGVLKFYAKLKGLMDESWSTRRKSLQIFPPEIHK